MASKDTQESSAIDYSTHHEELHVLTAQQDEENASSKASYIKTFQELPSLKVNDGTNTGTGSEKDIQNPPTTQTSRTAVQVTSDEDRTLMFVPCDSPLFRRGWISENSQTEDDEISSAEKRLKRAVQEVEDSGNQLQKCHEEKAAKKEREMADSRREQECCQLELNEYKEKCANLTDCNKNLRQQYESKIASLEDNVAKLQMEKKKEDTTHTEELEHLKKQHTEEKVDLFHAIQFQAKSCRKMDSELEELKTNYAEKEQDVEKLRKELEIKEGELEELGHIVRSKEKEIESIKKVLQEENTFATDEKLKSMLLEKEEINAKLKTCQGISELVSRLPNVTSQDERDEITEKVMSELRGISRTPSAKKAKSWR